MFGAPTASSSIEGKCQSDPLLCSVRWRTGQSSAPANREGGELPNEAPTAPRPLGTIKGIPRRLQQEQLTSPYIIWINSFSPSLVYFSSLCIGKVISL
jgi:hypothetical protein